jgi:hypothetical protein
MGKLVTSHACGGLTRQLFLRYTGATAEAKAASAATVNAVVREYRPWQPGHLIPVFIPHRDWR